MTVILVMLCEIKDDSTFRYENDTMTVIFALGGIRILDDNNFRSLVDKLTICSDMGWIRCQ